MLFSNLDKIDFKSKLKSGTILNSYIDIYITRIIKITYYEKHNQG